MSTVLVIGVGIAILPVLVLVASVLGALARSLVPGVGAFIRQWFMRAVGALPERKMTWGTVYDASTRRPIPFVKVQLLDAHQRLLEARVADEQGRYGFLSTPESLIARHVKVSLVATHAGYLFPAKTPASVDHFVYNNLYYGGLIEVNDQMLINFDIPMDPVAASEAPRTTQSPSIFWGIGVAAIADAGLWLGAVLVPLSFILNPNPFTFGVLCLFLGTVSLRIFGITDHPYGTVTDARTGNALPFALITLNDRSGKRVAFTVSDERGRYFLTGGRGEYDLSVFTPATIIPPRHVQLPIHVRGWITRELKV